MKKSLFTKNFGLAGGYPNPYDINFGSCTQKNKTNNYMAKVVDSNGQPLMGANVIHTNNSSIGVMTDYDGNFNLPAFANSTGVTISYVGYKTVTLAPGNLPSVITLQEDATQLDEVVLIGKKISKSKLFGFGLIGVLLLTAMVKRKGNKKVKATV